MSGRFRRAAALGALLVLAGLALPQLADGAYQGSDLFENVAPPTQLDRTTGLMHRYPSGHYALDTHVDVGFTNPGGVFGLIPHLLASQIWDLTRLLVLAIITVFTWAFSLDLLTGSGGRPGALAPVADAVESVYTHTLGRSWLVVAILLAGLWGIWKALVQRRYVQTAAQLAVSVVFVVLALFFVHQPEQTIGRASAWTNQLSLAFLSGATTGSVDDPGAAKQRVADHLFRTLVFEPWVVLNFGGLRHCVDSQHRPVAPDDPRRVRCIDHVAAGGGRGGYAERFLRYSPGSEARNAEYEAIRDGDTSRRSRLDAIVDAVGGIARGDLADAFAATADAVDPADPGQFAGYTVDADDRPAVDIQQQGGGFQRLTMATLIFAGTLGAVLLLGALSLGVVLAQALLLLLLAFAPLALVAAVYPGRGHDFFRAWLTRLVEALLRKALYSLVLAVVLAVAAALLAATASLGWLLAFGLQAAFYWTVFLYRKDLAARLGLSSRLAHATPVHASARRLRRALPPHRRHQQTPGRGAPTVHAPGRPSWAAHEPRSHPGAGGRRHSPDRSDPAREAGGQSAGARPAHRAPTRRRGGADTPQTDGPGAAERRNAAAAATGRRETTHPRTKPAATERADESIGAQIERDRRRLDERPQRSEIASGTDRRRRLFPWRRA